MRTVTPKQQSNLLTKQLSAVSEGIDLAIEWLDSARQGAARLDMEADRLKVKLRRCRTHARHLSATAVKESTLAFYGLSQAGKAWLLTSLVANANGRLETTLAGRTLDYFTHINPDNQDCGIVTRFSRQAEVKNKSWPVELTLLNEADITRMVISAWLQDAEPQFDELQVASQLQTLMMHRQPEVVAGISSDEMVMLWDSLLRHDTERQKQFEHHFWPMAVELGPWLTIDDRAQLFSLLWDGNLEMTALWRQLAHTLQNLAGARKVLAPLSLLVDDAQFPAEALLAPSAAASLNATSDRNVQVCPRHGGRAAKPVEISLAELSLLTVEILIPLHSTPRESLFEQTDVLEIPGLGAPLDEFALQEMQRIRQQNPLAAKLQCAKRGYLLERYSDLQAINLLMVCSAASRRDEVKPVSQALDYWVKQTQGENAQIRSGRKPALIWAVTQFDPRHFHQQNFDEAVQRRVGNPGDVWGSMLAHDRGSVQRMASWLAAEVRREVKLERIKAQLQELQREIADNLLASWHDTGAADPQEKQLIGERLLKALQTRTGLHGELLERLQPSREALRHLYLQRERPQQVEQDPTQHTFGIGIEIDLFSDIADDIVPPDNIKATLDDDAQFAENVQRHWINHLRALPENGSLLELLGIDKATLETLVEELIVASFRLDIGGMLHKMLTGSETVHNRHEAKTDRQVSRALTVIGDFVSWLGFLTQSDARRPDSRINRGHKIFAQPETPAVNFGAAQRLTRLSLAPANTTAFYIYDWLVGLNALIVQNSGHSSGAELDRASRERLTEIIELIRP